MHNIEVKIEGLSKRRKTIGLFHVITGLFLLSATSEYFKASGYKALIVTILIGLIALLSVVYGIFRQMIDTKGQYNQRIRYVQAGFFLWLAGLSFSMNASFTGYSLLVWSCICIIFLFTERKLFQNPLLVFNKEKINLPNHVFTKSIYWDEVENLVIRPDFVTIQYTDNRYVQYEVAANVSAAHIQSINTYCQQQLGEVALLKLK